jgi:hypothetical protein
LEVLREGFCFRPVSRSGEPIISRVPDEKLGGGMTTRHGGEGGVFVSAGHGPWGRFLILALDVEKDWLIELYRHNAVTRHRQSVSRADRRSRDI